jgi:hypothetical protein
MTTRTCHPGIRLVHSFDHGDWGLPQARPLHLHPSGPTAPAAPDRVLQGIGIPTCIGIGPTIETGHRHQRLMQALDAVNDRWGEVLSVY